MQRKNAYDYILILVTAIILFVISVICVYGMFYFKLAQVQQLPAGDKLVYMDRMNTAMIPFLIALILVLGICVPKRLLPTARLNRFAVGLTLVVIVVSLLRGITTGLIVVLLASLVLQLAVLFMALAGSQSLHFEKKGYWVRLGSSLIHLGLILFVLDLFFYRQQSLHLVLFWIMTAAIVLGMLFCFYADTVKTVFGKK